jgi:hypothetical protein
MKTLLLFAGIIFPIVAHYVLVDTGFMSGTPLTFSLVSVIAMLMIFFSTRYEAAAVFYLCVGMSNIKFVMLPMYIPMDLAGFFSHFLVAMYLALYFVNRKSPH